MTWAIPMRRLSRGRSRPGVAKRRAITVSPAYAGSFGNRTRGSQLRRGCASLTIPAAAFLNSRDRAARGANCNVNGAICRAPAQALRQSHDAGASRGEPNCTRGFGGVHDKTSLHTTGLGRIDWPACWPPPLRYSLRARSSLSRATSPRSNPTGRTASSPVGFATSPSASSMRIPARWKAAFRPATSPTSRSPRTTVSFLVSETYWTHGSRGQRQDLVSIWDAKTLKSGQGNPAAGPSAGRRQDPQLPAQRRRLQGLRVHHAPGLLGGVARPQEAGGRRHRRGPGLRTDLPVGRLGLRLALWRWLARHGRPECLGAGRGHPLQAVLRCQQRPDLRKQLHRPQHGQGAFYVLHRAWSIRRSWVRQR